MAAEVVTYAKKTAKEMLDEKTALESALAEVRQVRPLSFSIQRLAHSFLQKNDMLSRTLVQGLEAKKKRLTRAVDNDDLSAIQSELVFLSACNYPLTTSPFSH